MGRSVSEGYCDPGFITEVVTAAGCYGQSRPHGALSPRLVSLVYQLTLMVGQGRSGTK
jgi:hypothetical protein